MTNEICLILLVLLLVKMATALKEQIYLASRYTHGVTANQIYTDTSPCNASNPIDNSYYVFKKV